MHPIQSLLERLGHNPVAHTDPGTPGPPCIVVRNMSIAGLAAAIIESEYDHPLSDYDRRAIVRAIKFAREEHVPDANLATYFVVVPVPR